jgi:5-(carboxyamino)imidazole ribonucleotide synthase
MPKSIQEINIGILGGGQLGRMLIQSAIDLDLNIQVLDPDPDCPCSSIAKLTTGSLTDFNTVIDFGKLLDVITVEIENVNTLALKELENQGKKVFPQSAQLALIQDKCLQKKFYVENGIPTAEAIFISGREEAKNQVHFLPAVNKMAREGYDGKGVQIIMDETDLHKVFDVPGLLEKHINFDKEIAVIVARNENGETVSYPPVEMVFNKEANLVEFLFCPAEIGKATAREADLIARKIIDRMGLVGILAVEMFVTKEGEILVNEVAPRPHNSGHQTIEANYTSQYEQHLRAILNLPLGDSDIIKPSSMINLLGEKGYEGPARYKGLENVLKLSGTYIHLYGKKTTKPFRKMGHVTILGDDLKELKEKTIFVKNELKVLAK